MAIVTCWADLVDQVSVLFPEIDLTTLKANEGDIGALILQLSSAHELTFAEAAEMVAFRLPQFLEQERLSA